MSILNPIVNAAVTALDPAVENEHRLQSLLRLWLGNYFTGAPFTTRALAGGTEQRTFAACDYMWQEDEMPKDPQKPLIHVIFTNVGVKRLDMQAGAFGHDDRWQIELMVKVPVNLTDTGMPGQHAENLVRRVAGQVAWLFASSERAALAIHGVVELKTERPPVLLPGTSWHVRMMQASCLTRRVQAK
jgi:hypothetical protein